MADAYEQRPKLILPLAKSDSALEIVRERPRVRREVEHPHCDEHFLFTPYCAACLEAERTQHATAKATPLEPKEQEHRSQKPQQSSRSFGFTDDIPYSLTHEPTLTEQLARFARTQAEFDSVDSLADNSVGSLIDTLLET